MSGFNIWNDHRFMNGDFEDGDGSGDGVVNNVDFNIWAMLIFTDWTTWPTAQGAMTQGSTMSRPTVDDGRLAGLRAAFAELLEEHQIYKNGEINTSPTDINWNQFADQIFETFGFPRP